MNFATFDLNLLRVLDALLSEGSTVRAAEKLNLSQSSVSGALSRLRDALGDPLFIRQGNRLVATEFARQTALPLRQELDRIKALLAPSAPFSPSAMQGSFRIAATDFFADLLMPELARQLGPLAPGLALQLVDLVPSDYLRSIEDRLADLVLIPDMQAPDWIERTPLFTAPFVVVARLHHPDLRHIQPDNLLPLDLFCALGHVLMSPEGNLRGMGDAALERLGRQRRVVLTLPAFSGVLRAVSETDLIALIPRQLAERAAAQFGLALYHAPIPAPRPLICAFWHARETHSPQHRFLRHRVIDLMAPLA